MKARSHLMDGGEFVRRAAEVGLLIGFAIFVLGQLSRSAAAAQPSAGSDAAQPPSALKPPADGEIPVAFLISNGAVMIDFSGPWEVFEEVTVPGRPGQRFRLYTVSENAGPIRASGGMKIVPDYTLSNAPAPKVIVIPAQARPTEPVLEWIRNATKNTDVTMSVCTGAFILAKTGLLAGKSATTFHGAFARFASEFPDVHLKRGARFVEEGNLATAGGLSSGIDLALHVVERYYGRDVAERTAYTLEYQGKGWMNPDSNELYANMPLSTSAHPLCPVCGMDVDPASAPKSVYKGETYYFCSEDDKQSFDTAPEKLVAERKL